MSNYVDEHETHVRVAGVTTIGTVILAGLYNSYRGITTRQARRSRQAAVVQLQNDIHRPLRDSDHDRKLILDASSALIPARLLPLGRGAVLEWLHKQQKGRGWAIARRTAAALELALAAILYKELPTVGVAVAAVTAIGEVAQTVGAATTGPDPQSASRWRPHAPVVIPSGLRVREHWLAVYPDVLEVVLTDPQTGKRRPTADSYRLAKLSPRELLQTG
jgi:hypothetical protein